MNFYSSCHVFPPQLPAYPNLTGMKCKSLKCEFFRFLAIIASSTSSCLLLHGCHHFLCSSGNPFWYFGGPSVSWPEQGNCYLPYQMYFSPHLPLKKSILVEIINFPTHYCVVPSDNKLSSCLIYKFLLLVIQLITPHSPQVPSIENEAVL